MKNYRGEMKYILKQVVQHDKRPQKRLQVWPEVFTLLKLFQKGKWPSLVTLYSRDLNTEIFGIHMVQTHPDMEWFVIRIQINFYWEILNGLPSHMTCLKISLGIWLPNNYLFVILIILDFGHLLIRFLLYLHNFSWQ